jgi:hypothetical protein
MDWWLQDPLNSAANSGLSYSRFSWMHLLRLTELTSLRVLTYTHHQGSGQAEFAEFDAMTLVPLTKLRRLALPGCVSLSLILSIAKLGSSLQELDLSFAWPHVTAHAVIQVNSLMVPCIYSGRYVHQPCTTSGTYISVTGQSMPLSKLMIPCYDSVACELLF